MTKVVLFLSPQEEFLMDTGFTASKENIQSTAFILCLGESSAMTRKFEPTLVQKIKTVLPSEVDCTQMS